MKTGVISDVNGFYTFANLNPGTYTVKVTYVGYAPVEMKITIPEGKTLERDVILNEGVELQEIVIGGAFQGQRRAINSQKSSLGIKNVVSADPGRQVSGFKHRRCTETYFGYQCTV
ncbi:carboxypeptidase-like regulatory domain-containing protein [Bacteroides fragilis]|nr:carboxypeptidase-like regulatory domain-containing protein [Bacteroides fragilis]